MTRRCRSRRPSLAVGEADGTAVRIALRAAIGAPPAAPFRLPEVLDAARMLAAEHQLPLELLAIGVASDLMCGGRRPPRAKLCRLLRISAQRLAVYELTWEHVDDGWRFAVVRQAVAVVLATRAGGGA